MSTTILQTITTKGLSLSSSLLNQSDKVIYLGGHSYLEMIGFKSGQEYSLIKYNDGGLLIKAAISAFDLPLVMPDGEPTEFFNSFKKAD